MLSREARYTLVITSFPRPPPVTEVENPLRRSVALTSRALRQAGRSHAALRGGGSGRHH
jgi:hypothetical protein